MRIVGGRFRSIALAALGKGDAGAHLRPTADRVRESLFNVLAHRDCIDGARVLDLFAGTGALGFEALSRGAAHVTFVDDGRVARRLIRENMTRMKVTPKEAQLLSVDARRLPPCDAEPCDLVFLDPPYGKSLGEAALQTARSGGWLAPDAVIVWEESAPVLPPDGFALLDRRRYGDTHVTILQAV